jgi:hypothetical protein
MNSNTNEFTLLPIEEQFVRAQSFRDGSIEDLVVERQFVSKVDAIFLRQVKASSNVTQDGERFAALMRAWGR